MASGLGPITSWKIDGKKIGKQWQILFSWALKSLQIISAAIKLKDTCSLEETMTNLDSIFKSRDITLPTKIQIVKAVVFPVVMYGCESWTIKKVDPQRIDVFELWCWRRLLRVPCTARRSNQSILKEISPGEVGGGCSVAQSHPTLCHPMDCSAQGFPVHHQLRELTQTHVHWVGDTIHPSHHLSSLSPPTFNLFQHQGFFQWVSSLH